MRKNLIRMDVHIYSVKAENQAVNIWVYVMKERTKLQDAQLEAPNIYGKFSRRPRIQERVLLGLRFRLCEYI